MFPLSGKKQPRGKPKENPSAGKALSLKKQLVHIKQTSTYYRRTCEIPTIKSHEGSLFAIPGIIKQGELKLECSTDWKDREVNCRTQHRRKYQPKENPCVLQTFRINTAKVSIGPTFSTD